MSKHPVDCLVIFSPPPGILWWNQQTVVATKIISPLRRVYRNQGKDEMYVTGHADERMTSSMQAAFPGVTWRVSQNLEEIRRLVPSEFQFVR